MSNTLQRSKSNPGVYRINSPASCAALTRSEGNASNVLRDRIINAIQRTDGSLYITGLEFKRSNSGKWYVRISTGTALAYLWDQLEQHDWYFEMSDDHSVWKRGTAAHDRLLVMAKSIKGGDELYKEFSAHYFTGKSWGNANLPKPARPTN